MKTFFWLTGWVVILSLTFLVSSNVMGQSDEIPEVVHMPTAVGDVTFPHLEHIEDQEIECSECHHYANAKELDMPHKKYFDDFWIDCETCHVPGAGPMEEHACSDCHLRDAIHVTVGNMSAKAAIHKSCWGCHEVETGAEASALCEDCHVRDAN